MRRAHILRSAEHSAKHIALRNTLYNNFPRAADSPTCLPLGEGSLNNVPLFIYNSKHLLAGKLPHAR